ncbi:MAG: calcium/sodium antiporter [Cellvibrionaceae bacterium]|nr:calcium/sodium antiporter [Cellvibrionaceae bacterium]
MLTALLPWAAIFAGFIGLLWSADRFIEGSAAMAGNLGVSKFMIGLTIVAFGTSAPEVVVSVSSSLNGSGDLAVGNALGSNLANIGLVLGITALVRALPVHRPILQQEFPIMLAIMAVAGGLLWDGHLQQWEGLLLIGLLLPLLIWLAFFKKANTEADAELPHLSSIQAVFWFIVGLILLIVSSEVLVWGAKTLALNWGVSPLIVGLTIVAIGTSLPELAASIGSALKGHHEMAVGNIIGSNIFNLLLVMGVAPTIESLTMDRLVFFRDFLSMTALSVALGCGMLISCAKSTDNSGQIGRKLGALLLLLYAAYYLLLFAL